MSTSYRRGTQAQKQLQLEGYQQAGQYSVENSPGIGHNSGEISSGNWIAVARDMREHPIIGFGKPVKPADPRRGSYSRAEAWLDLIMEANWFRRRECNKGKVVYIERGQLMAARSWLAGRWNWTEKTVRGFLEVLECDTMIARNQGQSEGRNKGHFANVITICNYDTYQTAKELEALLNDRLEGQSRASQGPVKGQTLNKETIKQEIQSPIGDSASAAAEPEKPKGIKPAEAARMAMERYNEVARRCGLSIATKMTAGRQKAIVARIREAGGMSGFDQALGNLEKSAWLQGSNDRGWKADFDFICQAKSFARLMDGGYGNGAHAREKSNYSKNGTFIGATF